jgi:transcriptional regulator with XRE-family HTH domain
MLSDDRRAEIAAILRSRRERVRPEQAGLPGGSRRRTPGLRREEVAALAGVSAEWYTWLEQARDVRASADALQRIAAALRLEPGETRHLLALSGHAWDGEGSTSHAEVITPHLQRLVERLESCPTWVLGERWDILAWNRAATVILGDLGSARGLERNALHVVFLSPRFRKMLVDWEAHARDMVAKIRLVHARHVEDPWFNEIVGLLRERSAEFASWWDQRLVQLPRDGTKHYDHPQAGRLSFDYTVLDVADERFSSLQLVSYLPTPGTDTERRLQRLLRAPARARGARAPRQPR